MGFFSRIRKNRNIINHDGLNEIYFNDGKSKQIKSRYWNKGGVKNGEFQEFNDRGTIVKTGTYHQGLEHGTIEEVNDKGKIIYEYHNGVQHGTTSVYDIKGQLLRSSVFEKGEKIYTSEFYLNGRKKFEIDCKDDQHTFYSKKGEKILVAYINIRQQLTRYNINRNILTSEKTQGRKFSAYDGLNNDSLRYKSLIKHPFGKWLVYENNRIKYELDFAPYEHLGLYTVIKLFHDKSEQESNYLNHFSISVDSFADESFKSRWKTQQNKDFELDDIIVFPTVKDIETFKSQDHLGGYQFNYSECALFGLLERASKYCTPIDLIGHIIDLGKLKSSDDLDVDFELKISNSESDVINIYTNGNRLFESNSNINMLFEKLKDEMENRFEIPFDHAIYDVVLMGLSYSDEEQNEYTCSELIIIPQEKDGEDLIPLGGEIFLDVMIAETSSGNLVVIEDHPEPEDNTTQTSHSSFGDFTWNELENLLKEVKTVSHSSLSDEEKFDFRSIR